jgi:hypothetical protein
MRSVDNVECADVASNVTADLLFFFRGDIEFFEEWIGVFDGIWLIDAMASTIRWPLFEARSNRR